MKLGPGEFHGSCRNCGKHGNYCPLLINSCCENEVSAEFTLDVKPFAFQKIEMPLGVGSLIRASFNTKLFRFCVEFISAMELKRILGKLCLEEDNSFRIFCGFHDFREIHLA